MQSEPPNARGGSFVSQLESFAILRNKLSYKNSLPIWRAVFVSMPGKPDTMGLSGLFLFSVSLAIHLASGPALGMAAW